MAPDGTASAVTAGIRVGLADDEDLVRDGWASILSASDGLHVAGEARDGVEAVELAAVCDVILMDLRMPTMDGLEATETITRQHPQVKTVVVTTFESDSAVWSAMRAGAAGFVLKRSGPHELINAVRTVHVGNSLLFPDALRRIAIGQQRPRPARAPELTERETQVLLLLARGLTNTEIAERLYLGSETIITHMANILRKLSARDRTHAAVLAYELGFVHPGIGW